MAKADILIAEDDAVLRGLYIKKFSVGGYTVRTAENGEETLKAIQERVPDMLLLDINMPKMDGFQVLQKFPKESRKFPVIVLTNFDEERYKAQGKELGADGYFVKKDMTIRSLLEMVERLLEQKK